MIGVNGLRLTLTTGTPFTTSDVATASTLYLTPFESSFLSLYYGSMWITIMSPEISIALSSLTSGKNYDVWAYFTGSAAALELLVWTNDSTRATALTSQDGVLVKTGDATRRYMGTIRTISTTATADSAAQRFCWNYSNRVDRTLKVIEATDSWTYTTASFHAVNAAATNCVEWVTGTAERIQLYATGLHAQTGGAPGVGTVGIGIDSTTANSASLNGQNTLVGLAHATSAIYSDFPALGYHKATWLECGSGSGSVTWYGDAGAAATLYQTGMIGTVRG